MGLTFRSSSCIVCPAPHHGVAREGKAQAALPAGQGNFPVVRLSEASRSCRKARSTGYNLPGGMPERIKRGKEKVVTRAVVTLRRGIPAGIRSGGYTVLPEAKKKSFRWSSNFLNYIMESLILAQNERWRRG